VPEFDHLQGIHADKVAGTPFPKKDLAAAIDLRQTVQATGHRPMFIDQAAAGSIEEGAGGEIVFGHLRPGVIVHVVEKIGVCKVWPALLQLREPHRSLLYHSGTGGRRQLLKAGAQQPGIKEGDIEEAAAAAAATIATNDGSRKLCLFGGKPEVKGGQEGLITLEKFVHPVILAESARRRNPEKRGAGSA